DMMMHEPARFAARTMTARGYPAWLYRFTYVVESLRTIKKMADHSDEVPFFFQTLAELRDGRPKSPIPISNKDKRMAKIFSTYLGNFAKNIGSRAGGLKPWPKFPRDPLVRFELMNFTQRVLRHVIVNEGPVYGSEPRKGVALVEEIASQSSLGFHPPLVC